MIIVVVFGAALLAGFVVVARRFRRTRDAGEALLAAAAPGATVLFVDRERVWRPDGSTVAVLRPAPPSARVAEPEPGSGSGTEPESRTEQGPGPGITPGARPGSALGTGSELAPGSGSHPPAHAEARPGPGPGEHPPAHAGGARPQRGKSGAPLLDGVRWLWYNPPEGERLSVAYGPDGAVLFMVDRIPTGWELPETAVLGPAGALRATIRRTVRHPAQLALFDAEGATLGGVTSTGSGGKLLTLLDAAGRRVGAIGRGRGRRVLVLEQGGEALREAAIAFAVDLGRLSA